MDIPENTTRKLPVPARVDVTVGTGISIVDNNPAPTDAHFDLKRLEDAVILMINTSEFYANLLLQTKIKIMDLKNKPKQQLKKTAAVTINKKGEIVIRVNPYFFDKFGPKEHALILMHELAHVILGHLAYRVKTSKPTIMNIAQDVAIHEILTEIKSSPVLGETCASVESLNEQIDEAVTNGFIKLQSGEQLEKLKHNDTSEEYYRILDRYFPEPEKQDDGEGMDSLDDHDWDDIDEDVARAATAQALNRAISATRENGGTVPQDAILTLERMSKSRVRWQDIMRRYVGSNVNEDKRTSRNRRNRRHDDLNIPGVRKGKTPRAINIIDTSGSMSMTELDQVWAEFVKLEKLGFEVLVIEADCQITKKPYSFSKRSFVNFVGGGGTMYQPAIDEAMKYRPDIIVYFGDMDAADTPKDPKVPFLWLTTKNHKPPGNFGKAIDISG